MAKGKKKSNEPDLPEGFEPVSSRLDGFFIVEEGNSIQGVIRDSFMVRGQFGEKRVYKIEITSGTTRVMNGDQGEMDAEEGATVGVDEKGYLKKLADYAKGTEVFLRCIGREETAKKGQQPAWKFQVAVKEGKIPF